MPNRPSPLFTLLAFAALWVLCAPAWAARSVLGGELLALGVEPEETALLQQAFDNAFRQAPGLDYAPAATTSHCAGDLACQCAAARKAGTTSAAFGNVARIDKLYTIELVLIGAQSCSVENSLFVSEQLLETAAHERVGALVRQLLVPKEALSETATLSEREVDQVPAIVTVITSQQIRDLGITSVAELVRLVPGFEVLDANWGDRVLDLGLPGTTLLLVDGIPRNDPMTQFGTLGYDFTINLQQVERVEFVRGPGSVLWGSNAFLGIINFITRTPSRQSPAASASVRYGTAAHYEAHAEVEQASRWLSYAFSATFQSREGPRTTVKDSMLDPDASGDVPWGNSGITEPKASRYFDLVGRVRLAHFEFLADYINDLRYYQISPSGSLLNADSPGSWKNAYGFFSLSWEDDLSHGFHARVAASRFQRNNSEVYVERPADPRADPVGLRYLQGDFASPRSSDLLEARLVHSHSFARLANRALLGLSFNYLSIPDSLATEAGVHEEPRQLHVDFAGRSTYTLAAFLEEELTLDRQWSLSGGLRYENRGESTSVLKKQAALLYTGQKLRGKLVYSEGYRTPEANALYSTVGVEGNPTLSPESSRAGSLEVTWLPVTPLTLVAGGTWVRLFDLIVYDPATASPGFIDKPINSRSRIDVLAAYAQVRLSLGSKADGFVNYTYKDLSLLKDPAAPSEGFYVAPHTASLGAVVRPVDDFSFFLTMTFVSQREIQLQTPEGVRPTLVPPTFTSSLGFSLRRLYFSNLSLDFKLDNPLGLTHYTPHGVMAAPVPLLEERGGRELLVTLRWSP
ncbi:MAG: TonB-dependent receptor [Deltaproteobacteria bacterium]|nr:TonB-dependent receptor [Deltaproteobacteria bacterium]